MNVPLISKSRLNIRKALATLNLFILLSFANSANAGLITTVGEGWDGAGQNAFDVKYYFGNMTTDNGLSSSNIHAAFLVAFNAWSNATNNNLTFTEIFTSSQPGAIDISFEPVSHGDGNDFSATTLAHAFYPFHLPIGGDLHMNESFSWEIGNSLGSAAYDITRVAVHEIGHSIGIEHTIQGHSGFIMDPTIGANDTFSGLTTEDVKAVCSLYLCSAVQVPAPPTLGLLMLALFGTLVLKRKKERANFSHAAVL